MPKVRLAGFLLLLQFAFCASAFSQTYLFDHYNVSHGLPSNWVTRIYQDSQGYLWVAGDGGMSVYDGVSFKEIRSDPNTPLPLVWSVIESRKSPGTMFAGTHAQGVRRIRGERITGLSIGDNPSTNTSGKLLEDRNGVLWCGTSWGVYRIEGDLAVQFGGVLDTGWTGILHQTQSGIIIIGQERALFEYSPATGSITRPKYATPNRQYVSVYEDSDGTLWFGTVEGAIVKVAGGKITAQLETTYGALGSVAGDRDGNLWFSSSHGVLKVSRKNFPNSEMVLLTRENGLQENDIIVCYIDREDNLWVGGRSKGLSKLAYRNILRFQMDELIPDIINRSVAVDSSGHLFVAAQNRLWEFWKNNDGSWHRYAHRMQPVGGGREPRGLRGGYSVALAPDGLLWFAFGEGGLRAFRVTHRSGLSSVLEQVKVLTPGRELPVGSVLGIFITSDNQLWYNKRSGPLVQLDLSSGKILDTHEIGGEIHGGTVQSMCELPNGDLWVGRFNGGVSVLVRNGKKYILSRILTTQDGLIHDRVRSVAMRRNGDVWVGTRFNGISIYSNGKFRTLGAADGLMNNAVWRMAEDEEGRMWIGTSVGVQYTDPDSNALFRHPRLSGDQIEGIGCIPGKRTIWTLSSGELTIFDYGNEQGNIIPPLVSIAGLRINGIDRELENGQTFSHSENFCVIRFNGLSFKDPEGLQFRYRLIGLDTIWHEPTGQRTVAFGSLRPGKYTFEVRAMTADGTESDASATLAFAILPPWYLSPWSIGLYILFGSLSVFLYTKMRTRKLEKHSHELERIVAERTAEVVAQRNRLHEQAEKLQEIDVQKSHFFANISHEFRTPLTVILGHLDRLMNKDAAKNLRDYTVMDRNARRLLHFINQLLDLSKIEAGGMTLRAINTDIVFFVKRTTASLSSYAQHKGIDLTLNGAPPDSAGQSAIFAYFDHDKIEKVLVNLISNALKFTPHGGSVDVSLSSGHDVEGVQCVEISVKDTGTGIPAAKLPYVFDRFYQVEDYSRPGYEGTGIGLALVKELVELHHGNVSVQSTEGKGTTFTVRLPLGAAHLDEGEIAKDDGRTDVPDMRVLPDLDQPIPEEPAVSDSPDESRVLIVEDNADLRNFIREQLADEYAIIEAGNGKDGLRKAEDFMPDLVVSDIMMPEMDGYALCRSIKTNEKTNHIPVILLTAKATTENKLEGLELGADDYLMKPFNPQELQVRVRNLIQLRKQLREKFSSEMLLKPTEVTVPSQQKVFLERVTGVIEKHLAEEEFSVETLAAEIGMSRSQLHRKLKALTNKGPNELIRSFRLQRAAELIRKDAGSLAEIAYQVGFGSQAYFTRSFGEEFGVSPSEYLKASSHP
ncbi:MAG: response regulator [Bacteroidetes bacterium]|nr:response regulator [Bacteroidota bacterium]MCW5894170.1 response regulator [Bacteroidota bacterium]